MALELELAIVNAALDAFETRRRLHAQLEHVLVLAREIIPVDGSVGGSTVLSDEERILTALRIARKAIAPGASS